MASSSTSGSSVAGSASSHANAARARVHAPASASAHAHSSAQAQTPNASVSYHRARADSAPETQAHLQPARRASESAGTGTTAVAAASASASSNAARSASTSAGASTSTSASAASHSSSSSSSASVAFRDDPPASHRQRAHHAHAHGRLDQQSQNQRPRQHQQHHQHQQPALALSDADAQVLRNLSRAFGIAPPAGVDLHGKAASSTGHGTASSTGHGAMGFISGAASTGGSSSASGSTASRGSRARSAWSSFAPAGSGPGGGGASSSGEQLASFPSDRASLGRHCVFETNLSKHCAERFSLKPRASLGRSQGLARGRWRRRIVLFTRVGPPPPGPLELAYMRAHTRGAGGPGPYASSSSSSASSLGGGGDADEHERDPEAALRALPEAYVHVLKDDLREAERLRLTARSALAVVDRGLAHQGARFTLALTGQALKHHVEQWTFALDHEREVEQLRQLIEGLIADLQRAEESFAAASTPLPLPAPSQPPQLQPQPQSQSYVPPRSSSRRAAAHAKAKADAREPSMPSRAQVDAEFQADRVRARSSGATPAEHRIAPSAFATRSHEALPLLAPSFEPRPRERERERESLRLPPPTPRSRDASISSDTAFTFSNRDSFPADGAEQQRRISAGGVDIRNSGLDDDTESIASFEVGSSLGVPASLLSMRAHDNSSAESLHSTVSCPAYPQAAARTTAAASPRAPSSSASSSSHGGAKPAHVVRPAKALARQKPPPPPLQQQPPPLACPPPTFINPFEKHGPSAAELSETKPPKSVRSATEQLLYSLEDVLSPTFSSSPVSSSSPVTPKSFQYPLDPEEQAAWSKLPPLGLGLDAEPDHEAPATALERDAARKQAQDALVGHGRPMHESRPDSPTDPLSPTTASARQSRDADAWLRADTFELIGGPTPTRLQRVIVIDDSVLSPEEQAVETFAPPAELDGQERAHFPRTSPRASFTPRPLATAKWTNEAAQYSRRASADLLRCSSALSTVLDSPGSDDDRHWLKRGILPYSHDGRSFATRHGHSGSDGSSSTSAPVRPSPERLRSSDEVARVRIAQRPSTPGALDALSPPPPSAGSEQSGTSSGSTATPVASPTAEGHAPLDSSPRSKAVALRAPDVAVAESMSAPPSGFRKAESRSRTPPPPPPPQTAPPSLPPLPPAASAAPLKSKSSTGSVVSSGSSVVSNASVSAFGIVLGSKSSASSLGSSAGLLDNPPSPGKAGLSDAAAAAAALGPNRSCTGVSVRQRAADYATRVEALPTKAEPRDTVRRGSEGRATGARAFAQATA